MKLKAVLALLVVGPLLGLILSSAHVFYLFNHPYNGPDVEFTVNSGESFGQINSKLNKANLISSARVFHYYARYKGLMDKMQAGTFNLKKGMAIPDILNTLVYSRPILGQVTIPEGKNIYEIGQILEDLDIASKVDFINEVKNPKYFAQYEIKGPSIEGFLFPETYQFPKGTPVSQIVETMLSHFDKATADIDFSHPFLSKYQVITLASVVEKETGAKWERPTIAGVFFNRLKQKMRLQSDPTTIYGIFESFDGNLRKADLLAKTQFNTYAIPALPIGPICNPGIEAIKAVLNPTRHEYLYFVSKNDGTHIFTKEYQQHQKAVNDFQINKRKREGKSWRNLQQ